MSAVQAAENVVQMAAMAGNAGTSGQDNCNGCGGTGGEPDVATCSPVFNCGGMAAVLPMEGSFVTPCSAEVFTPVSSVAHSWRAPPDPYPPISRHPG